MVTKYFYYCVFKIAFVMFIKGSESINCIDERMLIINNKAERVFNIAVCICICMCIVFTTYLSHLFIILFGVTWLSSLDFEYLIVINNIYA